MGFYAFENNFKLSYKYQISRLFVLFGLVVLATSAYLLLSGLAFMGVWFFDFAWWSYILILDGLVFRAKRESLIFSHFRYFVFLVFWSAVLWFTFEIFNIRLENWKYINIPSTDWVRWAGYCISYSTVLPAIFETVDFLSAVGFIKNIRVKFITVPGWITVPSVVAGVVMLALPVVWPKYFFPLIWGGFVLLLDPVNYRFRRPSILGDWEVGNMAGIMSFLVAGFICGGLWELWNFWAKAKWIYQVPFVGDWKVFEMPVLGYLGFPPFALECFVMVSFLRGIWDKGNFGLKFLLFTVGLGIIAFGCYAVDTYTVKSFLPY